MSETTGQLDAPLPGSIALPGGTLRVSGWALFDGLPPDRVEMWLGDASAQPVRRGIQRRDVLDTVAPDTPASIASGFDSLVSVPLSAAGQWLPVHVRAWSKDGRSWTSEPVIVKIAASGPSHPPLATTDLEVLPNATRRKGPLRLLVFAHSLNLGGGELYLDELLARLAGGYDIELLVVSPTAGPLMDPLRERGIPVHITHGYAVNPEHYEGRVHELQALIAAWRPDVVLANTVGIFPPVDAALRLGVPVVWAIHESFTLEEFISLNWGSRGLAPEVEARMRHCLGAAHTVFVAQSTLQMFAEQVPELQGRHMHYGIDLTTINDYRRDNPKVALREQLGFSADDVVLLCMGVIQERKAQLALVLAFSEIASLFPEAQLLLVGGHGSEYSLSVEDTVVTLGLEDRVRVVPVQRDTYPWYGAADVLVSASDIESLPRSIMEAKAFGVPTLATDVFGLSEMITDGVNGWLCRPHSGNALVAGLYRVLSSTGADRETMSAACIAESQRFDGAGYARAYYDLAMSLKATYEIQLRDPNERAGE